MNICEERGTGVDKVIISIELHQLPAPDFRVPGENTVAVLFAPGLSGKWIGTSEFGPAISTPA